MEEKSSEHKEKFLPKIPFKKAKIINVKIYAIMHLISGFLKANISMKINKKIMNKKPKKQESKILCL